MSIDVEHGAKTGAIDCDVTRVALASHYRRMLQT